MYWLSRLILVSRSKEDRAEGLAEHIICLFGVQACLRKLFLSISLPLRVNNSPYLLPLKFIVGQREELEGFVQDAELNYY